MKTILNKTRKPIKIRLPGGKLLHLGPAKTGQVSDQASELPSFQKLLKKKQIEILGEGGPEAPGRTIPVPPTNRPRAIPRPRWSFPRGTARGPG